jgi:hypothetical protein
MNGPRKRAQPAAIVPLETSMGKVSTTKPHSQTHIAN